MINESEIYIHQFDNGIRLVFQHSGRSAVANCGLLISAGTRDEKAGKEGLAHFIEHTIFKGTKKRSAVEVINRLENVGGELNAFTSKEETCVYATFMIQYLDRALELIDDIVNNSVFPQKEIVKEKEVVLDEIRTYLDSHGEQIFDDFESMIFSNHPLGHPILGTADTVNAFKRNDIFDFIKHNYFTDKMVISITGDYKYSFVLNRVENYFAGRPARLHNRERKKFRHYRQRNCTVNKPTEQVHFIMGSQAPSYHNNSRLTLVLLNNILGGPALNSRLNLAIREKYGYTYNIESNYIAYSDTGMFNLYFATDKKYLERTRELVLKELNKLCTTHLTKHKLEQSKQQLIGQIAIAQENKSGVMLSLARSLLNYGKVETLENIFKKIQAITSSQILETANEVFKTERMSQMIFSQQ